MTATTVGPTVGSDLPARLAVGCRFEFSTAVDTHAVVIVEPHPTERRRVLSEQFHDPSDTPSMTYHDVFGNTCRRLTLPAGRSEFSYAATITNDAGFDDIDRRAPQRLPSELPDDALIFLLPSRYCPSDLLAQQAYNTFGDLEPGCNRVDTIAGWTHDHVTFDTNASSPAKTAADVLADGRGVCRDFTHLTISLCRALNIPARYVVGYLPDIAVPDPGTPMDFCAWSEVYLGDRWWTIDSRNHGQHRVGRTVIARGRDAADVAMTTTFGRADLIAMSVRAEPANEDEAVADATIDPSTTRRAGQKSPG